MSWDLAFIGEHLHLLDGSNWVHTPTRPTIHWTHLEPLGKALQRWQMVGTPCKMKETELEVGEQQVKLMTGHQFACAIAPPTWPCDPHRQSATNMPINGHPWSLSSCSCSYSWNPSRSPLFCWPGTRSTVESHVCMHGESFERIPFPTHPSTIHRSPQQQNTPQELLMDLCRYPNWTPSRWFLRSTPGGSQLWLISNRFSIGRACGLGLFGYLHLTNWLLVNSAITCIYIYI